MTRRILHTPSDVALFVRYIEGANLPLTVTVKHGADRSLDQNNLAFKWYSEVAAQKGDETPKQIRAYCKLHLGVPIRREEEDFRAAYDKIIRPLSYEDKLSIMVEPIDFPVTRDMTSKQMTQYLDDVFAEWSGRGFVLTQPEAAFAAERGIELREPV